MGPRSSTLIAAGILASRIAGLIRARLFSHYFGSSLYADVFNAALRVPNVLQNLLGEGTLSASFIPIYSELLGQNRNKEAGQVAGAVFSLLAAVAGGMALLGFLAAPLIVTVLVPGWDGERRLLTIQLVRILFPMTGFLVLSAWALGILNSHRKFFLSYIAPVVWNLAIIAVFVIFGDQLSIERLLYAVAWGALIGGGLQFAIQIPEVWRLERDLAIRWDLKLAGVQETMRNAGPAIWGRGAMQISAYFDMMLASLLSVGAVAAISYAQLLYLLPISLFGMSVAAAELPELSRMRAQATEALRLRTTLAMDRQLFFIIPSFFAFLSIGDQFVAALFQTGQFGPNETIQVYWTLIGYTLGLLAATTSRLYASAFYALRDTRTPARIATIRLATSAVMALLAMALFESLAPIDFGPLGIWTIPSGWLQEIRPGGYPLGAFGLAAGAGIGAWVEWALLRRFITKKIGDTGSSIRTWATLAGAAAAAAIVARIASLELPALHPWLSAGITASLFGAVYFIVSYLLGVEESKKLASRLLRRPYQ